MSRDNASDAFDVWREDMPLYMWADLGFGISSSGITLHFGDCALPLVDRYDIDGDKVYAMVQGYDSKPKAEGFWESHRKYLDVQYVAAGAEHMGYAPTRSLSPGDYQEENDFIKLEGDGEFFLLREGFFCILAPQDAHMPGMAIDQPAPVKKVVIKVLL